MIDLEHLEYPMLVGAAVDASATPVTYWAPGQRVRILSVPLISGAAMAFGNAASYGTVSLINTGSTGAGSTVVASRSFGAATANNISAGLPWELTLSTTLANLEIGADDVLKLQFTETGTATCGDLTKASVSVRYVPGYGGGV